ncbi:Histone-lysine N-methyltransferase ATXR3 [Hondaea fermentalgiana]|uniref:Histone-lysine N-methyltransferase ATXR3 n=1 Tax=Hondaea fermentalgiana TaxID=2315210 RepID=A0A2R5GT53_9STRA|nr:Histone-lysine N-methyltransferase ATXR3 [Hondaea fermentalgiana]|eukprot:GBG33499.1 Histone-lysine N-methyltransferase ATXR3 [Hondaea fermentalgiana]
MHARCMGLPEDTKAPFCCDSCTDFTGGGEKPRRVAKVKLQRDCPLCTNGLQGGFLATTAGPDVWAHASCVSANDYVSFDAQSRRADISQIPGERSALTCELCGKAGSPGCLPCRGGCGSSAFHATCALVLGVKSGYAVDRCPSCSQAAAVIRHRLPFLTALDSCGDIIPDIDRESLKAVINEGRCDRTPFTAELVRLKAIERPADKAFATVMRDLAGFSGPRTRQEKIALAAEYQRITKMGKAPATVLKFFRNIIPEAEESDILVEVTSVSLQSPEPSSRRSRPRFPGFRDSPMLYFDVERFANEANIIFVLSPGIERATVQLMVRTAARAIEELLLSRVFRVGVAERARAALASGADGLEEAIGSSTPGKRGSSSSKKRRKSSSAAASAAKNGAATSAASANGPEGKSEQDEDDVSLFKLEGHEVRMTNQIAYSVFSRVGRELEHNATVEPYLNGKWNKAPYPRRPYEEIKEYAPTPGLSAREQKEVLDILKTSKRAECDQSDLCAQIVPFNLAENRFETPARCKSRRVGCHRTAVGSKRPLRVGQQVQVADMWGLDCYTRRNVQTVLRMAAGLETELLQRSFVQRILLPVVDAQPAHRAHNLVHAMRSILGVVGRPPVASDAHEAAAQPRLPVALADIPTFESDFTPDDRPEVASKVAQIIAAATASYPELSKDRVRAGAVCLLFAVRNWGLNAFRVHPKGVGVQCTERNGLRSGTFVTEYLGELFAPWRWFEKQDAIKNAQKKCRFKPILPDFYNIMMERHEDDEQGYDVAYIDPIVRGNFASRLSHSCEPNCATVVMVVNGRYVVTVYTLREIGFGEELTFDYSSVTEDESEFKAATCLCGSLGCRGSFLYYAGVGAFAQVLADEHTFLHRNALVYAACANPVLNQDDKARLVRAGIKKAALRDSPTWLVKWTSLVLAYAERERDELAHRLCLSTFRDRLTYTGEQARLQAAGVLENRVQNVVITLNKLRHFFTAARTSGTAARDSVGISSKPLSKIPSPVRPVTPAELVDILWSSEGSHARVALQGFLSLPLVKDPAYATHVSRARQLLKMSESNAAQTYPQVQEYLAEIRNILWSSSACQCVAAGDLLTWILHTKHFFTAVTYPGMRSTAIVIRNVDIGRDGSVAASTQTTKKGAASSSKAKAATSPGDEGAASASASGASASPTPAPAPAKGRKSRAVKKEAAQQGQGRGKRVKRPTAAEAAAEAAADASGLVGGIEQAPATPFLQNPGAQATSLQGQAPPPYPSFTPAMSDLKHGFEASQRTPGPLQLPYWYGVDNAGGVVLSAATPENFTCISFEQDPDKPFLRGLRLASEPPTESPRAQKFFILTIPMPGCVPVYMYRPMRAGPTPGGKLEPVREDPSLALVTTRLVPDAPTRPLPIEGIVWDNIGLIYAFDVQLPGTDRMCALDHEGRVLTLFAFSEMTFCNRVRFLRPGETFHNSASSPQTASIPRAVDPLKVVFDEEKKYQSGYVWGQMSGWFKQTVASPDASLSAERRGTLSLPDMQSCFTATSYKDRQAIVDRVSKQPEAMWPTGSHWSFKNKRKLYGSPWLDDVIDPSSRSTEAALQEMDFHMQHNSAPPPPMLNNDAAMALSALQNAPTSSYPLSFP